MSKRCGALVICVVLYAMAFPLFSITTAQHVTFVLNKQQEQKRLPRTFESQRPYQMMLAMKELGKRSNAYSFHDSAQHDGENLFSRCFSYIGESVADGVEYLEKLAKKPAARQATPQAQCSVQTHEKEKKEYQVSAELWESLHAHHQKPEYWTHCYGTAIQQELHQKFVTAAHEAIALDKKIVSRDTGFSVASTIIDFADAGITYNRAHCIPQAYSIANFCWSLLECYDTISSELEGAIERAGKHLEEVFSSAHFDEYFLSKYCPDLTEEERRAELAFYKEGRQKQRETWRKASIYYLESALSGKLFSALARFLKIGKIGLSRIIEEFVRKPEDVVVATTGMSLSVKIKDTFGAIVRGSQKPLAALQNRYKYIVEGVEEILPEVAKLNSNDIHHILAPKHAWSRLVHDDQDWDAVARLISKVMKEGAYVVAHGAGSKKTLAIGAETVVVTLYKLPDGLIKIGNAWIKTI